MELLKYYYRKSFGLTALEVEQEPADQFATNIYIQAQLAKKQAAEIKHGNR